MRALLDRLSTGSRILGGGALFIALVSATLAASGASLGDHLGFRGLVTIWCGALLIHFGLLALSSLLRRGGGTLAVARVLVAETVRRRVAWICATLLLVGLAAIPYLVRSNSVLEYRLSSFLGYSLFVTFFLLSILTVFGASGSLCEEIDDRRIHSVVVKPIGRVRFLFGKWLGLVSLNFLLLVVAQMVTLGSFHWQVASAEGDAEQMARVERLLVTHHALRPEIPPEFIEQVVERAGKIQESDSAKWRAMVAAEGGNEKEALIHLQGDLYREALAQWRNVPPEQSRTYRFRVEGDQGGGARLLLAPHFARVHSSDRTRFLVSIEGEPRPVFLGGGESTHLEIPPAALADGEVVVVIESPDPKDQAHAARLGGKDQLSLEIVRGSLMGNLARGILILAIQLAFLAAVGIAAATFLGLPVAVLLVSMVLFAALGGGFFADDLESDLPPRLAAHDHSHGHAHAHGHSHDHTIGSDSSFVRLLDRVGKSFMRAFSAWGRYSPIDAVSSGTEIPLSNLWGCLLWIGGAWTGVAGTIGALVFRGREIARVQV